MHIAVDGSSWGGQERGVAVASRRLWSALLERGEFGHVTVFGPSLLDLEKRRASLIPVGPFAAGSRLAWQQLLLPMLIRELRIDLLHCPSYTTPIAASCQLVVTVHDLIAWTHPQLAGWQNALHLRLLVGSGVRRAAAVCVPTEFVRRSLISRFAISPEKVFVVPWGVDAEITAVQPDDAKRTIRDRFGVTEPYVLFCGCIEAKKNVQAAIRASGQAGLLLLIAGPWISRSSTILGGSPNMSGDGWLYLGYVSAADLSALYSAATALILPSHVEGFGLPAIEAMKCGCPVIASDVPALKEVCGGAALHVAPEDTAALTASLRLVASDSGLREDLSARGSANAERFSWAVAVDRFAEAVRFAAR